MSQPQQTASPQTKIPIASTSLSEAQQIRDHRLDLIIKQLRIWHAARMVAPDMGGFQESFKHSGIEGFIPHDDLKGPGGRLQNRFGYLFRRRHVAIGANENCQLTTLFYIRCTRILGFREPDRRQRKGDREDDTAQDIARHLAAIATERYCWQHVAFTKSPLIAAFMLETIVCATTRMPIICWFGYSRDLDLALVWPGDFGSVGRRWPPSQPGAPLQMLFNVWSLISCS
ncbi:MAG: hypothetical protein K2Y27_01425 [Xanthobacteraceae bacterium]|nr:hypothetical protein [Xanthobacteraceae bacterium]